RGETNFPVWSLDDDLHLTAAHMTHVFPSGTKPVFELVFASGKRVKAPANHPFYGLDGWKSVDTLKAGDRLAAPRAFADARGTTLFKHASNRGPLQNKMAVLDQPALLGVA